MIFDECYNHYQCNRVATTTLKVSKDGDQVSKLYNLCAYCAETVSNDPANANLHIERLTRGPKTEKI